MGWDADAIYDGKPFEYVRSDRDPNAASAFRQAFEEARDVAGTVDAFLSNGGLDVSDCVRALAKYANESDRDAVWSVAKTRELDQSISWPDLASLPEENRWAVVSARVFLRTCAQQGYGIQFG